MDRSWLFQAAPGRAQAAPEGAQAALEGAQAAPEASAYPRLRSRASSVASRRNAHSIFGSIANRNIR